tara:strand:+ start:3460 stop:4131 length:672 start_codon:yes stop_codon:yes gene_type:complete
MTERSTPHPKVTVYDNVIPTQEKSKLLSALVSGQFFLTLNNKAYTDENPDFVLSKIVDGDYWRYCKNSTDPPDSSHSSFDILRYRHISNTFENMVMQGKKDMGRVESFAVNVLTVADTLHMQNVNHTAMIYMANLKWKTSWSGELFIYDNAGKDILCTIPYFPNRVVVLDGDLSYRVSGPSASAPKYMVLATLQYCKQKPGDVVPKHNPSTQSLDAKPKPVYL